MFILDEIIKHSYNIAKGAMFRIIDSISVIKQISFQLLENYWTNAKLMQMYIYGVYRNYYYREGNRIEFVNKYYFLMDTLV